MATRPGLPSFGQGINGGQPSDWADSAAVDGDRPPWRRAPQGARYQKLVTANQTEWYEKVKDDGRNDDWVLTAGVICQRVGIADFTDGSSTAGHVELNGTIPAGAYFERTLVTDLDDFVGSSTVTFTIGDGDGGGGTDVDRYMTGTPSAAADANYLSVGAVSGTALHTAAATPRVIVTDDSDFGDLTAGAMTVTMFYRGALLG